jgi:hypothetical protein
VARPTLQLATLLLVTLLLTSCGTAYHGMPPRSLAKDEGYLGIGVAWSSLEPWAAWNDLAVNGHVWWGTGDHGAVGLAFSHVDLPFFFPEVSYAHFWAPDADGRGLVASVHGSLAWRWNPVFEAGLGAAHDGGTFAQLAWVGGGLWADGTVTPSLRYVAQNAELRGEVGYMPGRAATALRIARGSYFSRRESSLLELSGDEIADVRRDDAGPRGPSWTVVLQDGDEVLITPRGPHVDAWGEASVRGFIEKHPPAPGARLLWVDDRRGPAGTWHTYPLEANMDAALARFEREDLLTLSPDPDATDRAIARHGQWWRDVNLGLWWAWYDPAVLR